MKTILFPALLLLQLPLYAQTPGSFTDARDGYVYKTVTYVVNSEESTYPNFGRNAIFWSSNEKDEEYAWDWILATRWKKILRSDGHKLTTGNSVRCVKD